MKAIYIDEELHRQVKLWAVRRGEPLRRVVEDCVRRTLGNSEAGAVATAEVTAAAAGGGSFDLLARAEEDLYLPTDGKPIR